MRDYVVVPFDRFFGCELFSQNLVGKFITEVLMPLNERLREDYGFNSPYYVLAGGAIRALLLNKEPNDFDLFLVSNESFHDLKEIRDKAIGHITQLTRGLFESPKVYSRKSINDNGDFIGFCDTIATHSYKPIQLIVMRTCPTTINEVIKEFLFTSTQVACKNLIELHTFERSVDDLLCDELWVNPDYNKSITHPISILNQVIKYAGKYGFTISTKTLRDLLVIFSSFSEKEINENYYDDTSSM